MGFASHLRVLKAMCVAYISDKTMFCLVYKSITSILKNPDHTSLLTLRCAKQIPEGLASHNKVLDVSSKKIYRFVYHIFLTFLRNVMDRRDVLGFAFIHNISKNCQGSPEFVINAQGFLRICVAH